MDPRTHDPRPPAPPPLRCLLVPTEGAPVLVERVDLVGEDERSGRALACARCSHPITRAEARMTVNGRHVYERTNPGGFTYRFGCFLDAPGCASQGVPSKQATWFAGYFWHVQACARCGEQLGWLFFTADHRFFGLILDALVEVESPPPAG